MIESGSSEEEPSLKRKRESNVRVSNEVDASLHHKEAFLEQTIAELKAENLDLRNKLETALNDLKQAEIKKSYFEGKLEVITMLTPNLQGLFQKK